MNIAHGANVTVEGFGYALQALSSVCHFPSAISLVACVCGRSQMFESVLMRMITVLLTPYCRANVHARTTQVHQRRRLHLSFPHGPHDLPDAPWYYLNREGEGKRGWGRRTRARSSASTQAVLVQPVTWVPQRYVQAQTQDIYTARSSAVTRAHTHAHVNAHAQIHTYMYTILTCITHTHTHTHTHTSTHTCVHTYAIHPCIHTFIHKCVHTYVLYAFLKLSFSLALYFKFI